MISVIVPVYNVERYVKDCVDSILNQTYKDIELILVDDGSTDDSGTVCDECATHDERVRVIHKPNGGVSDARNVGIEASKGDYVCFLDGDDVFHPSMLKVMLDAVESGDYDFSMIYLVAVSEEEAPKCLKRPENASPHILEIDQKSYMKSLYGYGTNFVLNPYVVSTNKLFKRGLIVDLRFKNTTIEDVEFNNRMCLRMKKAIIVEEELYYWIQIQTSRSHAVQHRYHLLHFNLYEECLEAIPQDRPEYRKLCLDAMFKHILSCRYDLRNSDCYDESIKMGAESYKNHCQEYYSSGVSLPTRLMVKLFYHYPKLYVWFRALCDFLFVKMKLNDMEWAIKVLLKKLRNKKLVIENEKVN